MDIELKDEPNAPSSAQTLIQQRAALEKQTSDMIEGLLKERADLDRNYGETKDRIAADLKALGWHRTREAKAATEGATSIDKPKRERKKKVVLLRYGV